MRPWRVKIPTQNLLRLLLFLMLVMRIVLTTVCCRFGSPGLVITLNFCSDFEHFCQDFGKSIKDEKVYTNIQEMNEQIKLLISNSDVFLTGRHSGTRASKCNICGKLGSRSVIRDHIKADHISAIRRGCDLCGRTFKTRNSLMTHKIIKHSG